MYSTKSTDKKKPLWPHSFSTESYLKNDIGLRDDLISVHQDWNLTPRVDIKIPSFQLRDTLKKLF